MRPEDKRPEDKIAEAIEAIRQEPIDPETVRQSGERVWARISKEIKAEAVETISGCADFQALLPAYRAQELSEARTLLVRDHLHECLACRRVFMKQSGKPAAAPVAPVSRFQVPKWAIAAMLAVAIGLGSWEAFQRYGPAPDGPAAVIASVDGSLYKVSENGTSTLKAGEELLAGESVRTAREASALIRLRDGSLVEVKDRSGFSVAESRRDVTIRLARGSVIVEAAERASGHLYVSTRDCRVAVTGTVFSVNSGAKGSRVSVVEGEVRVAQGSRNAVLHPGQQYSTSPAMMSVPVSQEIAWSQNADQHIAVLKELVSLSEQMESQVRMPDARFSSSLLAYLPADTALYAAIPNLGETMADAYRVFQNRISGSPTLRDWWQEKTGGVEGQAKFDGLVDELRRVAAYLGDEIVISAGMDETGHLGEPVLLAEVKLDGLPEMIQAELAKHGDTNLRVFRNSAEITQATEKDLLLYVNQGLAAASPNAASLRRVAAAIEGTATDSFTDNPLREQIAESYRQGASFLLSADLERLKAVEKDSEILGNIQHLVIGQKQTDGVPDSRAIVTFAGERTGFASWLAAPAPIGALDYVTPEASAVAGAAVKQPTAVVDDLLAMIPSFGSDIAEAEAEMGLNVRSDLAAAFGSEFVIALDGSLLPVPSWKLVAEVYDPGRLQSSLRRLVDAVNRKAAADGKPTMEILDEDVSGRSYHTLLLPEGTPMREFHYIFADGYMIAGPTRVLLDKAIAARATGANLLTSAAFTSLLPTDQENNFSGLFYHNLGLAAQPFSKILTEEQNQGLQEIDAVMQPTLVLAYGAADRITIASTAQAFGFTPGNLFGLKTPMGLAGIFGKKALSPDGAAQ